MKIELEFHDAKSDPPKKNGQYLTIIKYGGIDSYTYGIYCWASNLYKVDHWDFGKERGKSGWYEYDSEYGYYKIDNVLKWAELPKITGLSLCD